jgi:hypothetical protein
VSVFEKTFNNLLEEELINSSTTWNTGIMPVHYTPQPKPYRPLNPDKPRERHRKIIKDPVFRKHAQTVPTMHKADPTQINAVKTPGKKLSEDEIKQICSKYGISRLNTQSPKRLGNTGTILKFNPEIQGYVIQ